MHLPWRELAVLTLLSLSNLVRPTPALYGNDLTSRADGDLPEELQPVLKDDGLPEGDAKDAAQNTDFDITLEELEECPDFDPQDEGNTGSRSRLLKRGARTGTTRVLREVYVQGKRYRDLFIASPDKRAIAIESTNKGKFTKKDPVKSFETKDLLPQIPNVKTHLQPQVDHIVDLGIFTQLAGVNTPPNIKEAAWTKVQDGVFGVQGENDNAPKATDNTKTLASVLHSVPNLRHISAEMNAVKSRLMRWAYTTDTNTPDFYKKVHRSAVWGAYRHVLKTKAQFDDTLPKAAAAIKGFVTDDDASAKAIETYFTTEGQKLLTKATDELAKALKDAPPDDDKKSIFKQEDCSNTADTLDDPTANVAASSPSPSPVAPSPSLPSSVTPPQASDTCHVGYFVAIDKFDIKGKQFDPTVLGANGQNLHDRLKTRCALIEKKWGFAETPGDKDGWQWHAWGQVGALQKKCIGDQLVDFGGQNCQGTG